MKPKLAVPPSLPERTTIYQTTSLQRPACARLKKIFAWTCVAVFLLAGAVLNAAKQKLILKDGTDQWVSEYQIQGDRVRYYSTEREDWEEMPAALVDWDATKAFNSQPPKPIDEDLKDLETPKPPPKFYVAPGIDLPSGEGVYGYDGKNLLGLPQTQAAVVNDRARKMMGSIAPIIKGKAYLELPGSAATVAFYGEPPVFYLQLSQPSSAGFAVVKVKLKDNARVIGEISINPFTQSEKESEDTVPVTTEQLQPGTATTPAVIRLKVNEPLKSGEYAVVEYAEKEKMNLFVWDFGYHPDKKKR